MPNHVHLIVVPDSEEGLRRAIGEAHRRYSRAINFREDWRGHLWQGRFASSVMDERYLLAAARYVEWNPVRAGLCEEPSQWRWSSARAHLEGRDDDMVEAEPLPGIVGNWREFLHEDAREADRVAIRKHQRTGRPLGSDSFITELEKSLGRVLRPEKPGPARKVEKRCC